VDVIILIAALLVMAAGLAGTILPFLPGIPLIYAGYVIYGLGTGWRDYGGKTMLVWGAVVLVSIALDYYAGILGAKKYGASASGIWGSVLGGILGLVFLGFIGLLAGTFMGAAAGELLSGKSSRSAWRAGWGTFVGFLAGTLFKIVLGVVMIGAFLWRIVF
jgi:uncharacterized protein